MQSQCRFSVLWHLAHLPPRATNKSARSLRARADLVETDSFTVALCRSTVHGTTMMLLSGPYGTSNASHLRAIAQSPEVIEKGMSSG